MFMLLITVFMMQLNVQQRPSAPRNLVIWVVSTVIVVHSVILTVQQFGTFCGDIPFLDHAHRAVITYDIIEVVRAVVRGVEVGIVFSEATD